MTPRIAVQFEQVRKVYRRGLWSRRGVQALRGVTLAVPSGTVFGLLGPNRAGKTTLVKILLSVCRPSSGNVTRLGSSIRDRSTLREVGYVHETQAFPGYLSARELLEYYGQLTLLSRNEVRLRSAELLERVGLDDRDNEPIRTFSKGMLQRLAIAQALVNDPQLLVLDEPTEGMDLLARKLLHSLIEERKQRGLTALLVSHSLADVEQLCDHAAVLRWGELAFTGTMDELKRHADEDAGDDSLEAALESLYLEAAV